MQKPNVLRVNGKEIMLTHASALLHDNAEGLLDLPTELRILLSDCEAPAGALAGIAFDLPVERMAKEGKLRGLLLKLDPNDAGELRIVLLDAPEDPHGMLLTHTLTSTNKDTIKGFKFAGGMASGTIEQSGDAESAFEDMPDVSYSASFQAALIKEAAITSDLKGKDAQNSAQAKIIMKKGEALENKDFNALSLLSTAGANQRHEVFLSNPAFLKAAPQAGAEMKKSVQKITRVVERGARAIVIFDGTSWANFVKEGQEWKSDD